VLHDLLELAKGDAALLGLANLGGRRGGRQVGEGDRLRCGEGGHEHAQCVAKALRGIVAGRRGEGPAPLVARDLAVPVLVHELVQALHVGLVLAIVAKDAEELIDGDVPVLVHVNLVEEGVGLLHQCDGHLSHGGLLLRGPLLLGTAS